MNSEYRLTLKSALKANWKLNKKTFILWIYSQIIEIVMKSIIKSCKKQWFVGMLHVSAKKTQPRRLNFRLWSALFFSSWKKKFKKLINNFISEWYISPFCKRLLVEAIEFLLLNYRSLHHISRSLNNRYAYTVDWPLLWYVWNIPLKTNGYLAFGINLPKSSADVL